MTMHDDAAMQRRAPVPFPPDLPHWTRNKRAKKHLCHLAVDYLRACDGALVLARDYLRSAESDPSLPVCGRCFNAWVMRRNAARKTAL